MNVGFIIPAVFSVRENSLILCDILLMRMCRSPSTIEGKLYLSKQKWTYYNTMTAETNVKWMKSMNNRCPFILNTHLSLIIKCTGQRSGILDSSPVNNRETHAVDSQTLSLSQSYVGQFRVSSSPNTARLWSVGENLRNQRRERRTFSAHHRATVQASLCCRFDTLYDNTFLRKPYEIHLCVQSQLSRRISQTLFPLHEEVLCLGIQHGCLPVPAWSSSQSHRYNQRLWHLNENDYVGAYCNFSAFSD